MSMELGQLSQMTAWLDEEHRRDKAELVRLQQRVESQAVELQDQARLVQELEGAAGVPASAAPQVRPARGVHWAAQERSGAD